ADRAGQHRRLVGQDVAEHVAGDDDVELARVAHELHRGVVDVHVRELDVAVVPADARHHLAPQLRGLEHVRLVDRADPPASLRRRAEGDVRDALDLGLAVAHGVEALAPARGERADAARLAEIDVARQLAQDQDVETRDDLGPERRGFGQLGIDDRRPQVREQPELLAQAQQRLLGTLRALERVPARAADRSEQDRVGRFRERERRFGQRVAARFVARPADGRFLEVEPQTELPQDLQRLGDDLRPDAVAREDGDLHDACSQGCSARRFSSKAWILSAWRSVRPMSSSPLTRQYLRNGSTSKRNAFAASLVATVWRSRSTTRRKPGNAATSWKSASTSALFSTTGSRP